MAKKKTVKKTIPRKTAKTAARKGPTRKCEKCETSYHPLTLACPKCGAANPSRKKKAPVKDKAPAPTKTTPSKKRGPDLTMTAVNFVEAVGGIEQAQETLDGLKQLFRTSTDE